MSKWPGQHDEHKRYSHFPIKIQRKSLMSVQCKLFSNGLRDSAHGCSELVYYTKSFRAIFRTSVYCLFTPYLWACLNSTEWYAWHCKLCRWSRSSGQHLECRQLDPRQMRQKRGWRIIAMRPFGHIKLSCCGTQRWFIYPSLIHIPILNSFAPVNTNAYWPCSSRVISIKVLFTYHVSALISSCNPRLSYLYIDRHFAFWKPCNCHVWNASMYLTARWSLIQLHRYIQQQTMGLQDITLSLERLYIALVELIGSNFICTATDIHSTVGAELDYTCRAGAISITTKSLSYLIQIISINLISWEISWTMPSQHFRNSWRSILQCKQTRKVAHQEQLKNVTHKTLKVNQRLWNLTQSVQRMTQLRLYFLWQRNSHQNSPPLWQTLKRRPLSQSLLRQRQACFVCMSR